MQQIQEVKRMEHSKLLEFADAHCHLSLFRNPEETVAQAKKKGLSIIITSGGSADDSLKNLRLAHMAGVFAMVGVGPDFSSKDADFTKKIEALVRSDKRIIGIGEIGIDMKVTNTNSLETQRRVFAEQIDVARDLDLPIVIHSRGSLKEVSSMLYEKGVRKAMFHFFEGDEAQAKELTKRGYAISIPPVETGRRKRVIKNIGINDIVAETDSPIVGKTPVDVIKVCETIAELKSMPLEDVAAATTENIRRLFYI